MQRLNLIYCAYSWRSGGAVSPLGGLGKSAGGGETPGSSEKLHFTVPKTTLVWCIF